MTCDQCGKPIRGDGYRTATRVLCDECAASFQGSVAAVLNGGGVPEAVATVGWLERIRRYRRRDQDPEGD